VHLSSETRHRCDSLSHCQTLMLFAPAPWTALLLLVLVGGATSRPQWASKHGPLMAFAVSPKVFAIAATQTTRTTSTPAKPSAPIRPAWVCSASRSIHHSRVYGVTSVLRNPVPQRKSRWRISSIPQVDICTVSSTYRHFCRIPDTTMHATSRTTSTPDDNVTTTQLEIRDETMGLGDIGNEAESSGTSSSISWRELLEVASNKSRSIRGSNYVQIATVDASCNGEPRCRTVVFRGFTSLPPANLDLSPRHHRLMSVSKASSDNANRDESSGTTYSCVMKMITDSRSSKVHQVAGRHPDQNTCELVWWFPLSNEQFRIRGLLLFVGEEGVLDESDKSKDEAEYWKQLRLQQWSQITDAARASYFDSRMPGQPYEPDSKATDSSSTVASSSGQPIKPPPPNFLLMLLVPNTCDYLRLTDQYRQTDQYHASTNTWTMQRLNP
jgi:hypothetical protein